MASGDLVALGPTADKRGNIDLLCEQAHGLLSPSPPCTQFHAMLSVSAGDEIRDMPALYGVPTNVPAIMPNMVQLATNWADLTDGTVENPMTDGGFTNDILWTGSSENGRYNVMNNCSGWSSASSSTFGAAMRTNLSTSWLYPSQLDRCHINHSLLCMCF